MLDIKKLIILILSTFGISGLLSTIGIVLIGLNWNHSFVINEFDMNNIVNSFIVTILVIYCLFILFHTKGQYSKLLLEKIIPIEETKLDVNEIPSKANEVLGNTPKRTRKGSIVKISPDGAVEIIV